MYRVLLVEDDEELRDGLSQTLSIFFNKVIIAKNGIEALEILAQNKIFYNKISLISAIFAL